MSPPCCASLGRSRRQRRPGGTRSRTARYDSCGSRRRLLELRSPKLATRARLSRSLQPGESGMVRGEGGGAPSGVWVGWLGGEDLVDLRTSNRLTNPRTFGKLSGSSGLRLAAPMEGWDKLLATRANQFALRGLAHLTQAPKAVSMRGCRQKQFGRRTVVQCSLTSDVS